MRLPIAGTRARRGGREDGSPANPEAWLLTVARNRLRDLWKSHAYRMTDPLDETHDSPTEVDDMPAIPDRRLELMLVCAHPAIAPNIRTPLMLQTVLGVDAAAIAEAFAIEPAAMAQRLVRAKKRIRDAGIAFVLPGRDDLAARLPAVLEAVYGAYAIDWQLTPQGAPIETLSAEALHLALVLAELVPDEPEVLGLAALVCLSEARRTARRVDGRFVPLDEQDSTRWDGALIARGEDFLRRAHRCGRPGRFQYEAAIQSAALRRDPSISRRCASCTAPCCGSRLRWARQWRWPRWTVRSTGRTPACGRWTPSTTRPRSASSRRGARAHTCWPRQAGAGGSEGVSHRHRADDRQGRRRLPARTVDFAIAVRHAPRHARTRRWAAIDWRPYELLVLRAPP